MDLPDPLNAAVIPIDNKVFPDPPRRAAIIIRGNSIALGCID
jgi:hypothetical protein